MQTTKHPYELLVRWGQDGRIAGAHIQFRYVIMDGGAVVGESVGPAEALAMGEFPLADLLNQVQADALAEVMRLQTQEAALRAHISDMQATLQSQPAPVPD